MVRTDRYTFAVIIWGGKINIHLRRQRERQVGGGTGGEGDLGNIALSCNYTQKQQHIHISQSLTQPRTHQIRVLDT